MTRPVNTDRLFQAMAGEGMYSEKLVKVSGISGSTLGKVMRGIPVSPKIVGRLAKALSVSVEWIMGGDNGKV